MAEGSSFVRRDRRQKAAHSRSRTGCVTCKERHLRCDEGKPTCEQCRKSGRQCGGYTQVERNTGKRRHGYMTIRGFRHTFFPGPENAIDQDSRPRQDKRAFAFFRQRTLEVIQSCFPPQAWHLDALKLSYSVPAISHVLVAIATLDELQVKPSHLPISESEKASNPSYNAIKMLALQHYTKALSLTSASIEEKNLSSGTALLICLLFIIYETLNGSRASISAHLNNGVKLLRGTPNDGSDLEGMQITSAFRRISLHHALLGRPRSLSVPWLTTLKAPSSTSGYSFHDIQQARISLETLISSTLQLICAVRWTGCQVTRKMRQMQNDIRHQLSLWRAAFVELSDHMTLQESTSAKLLYLHYISISVYLESCTENETFCDRFEATFQEVVDLSRSLIIEESVPGLLGPDAVLFEGALLSPLLSVAIKCRHSKIRREALRLLRLAPRREGYWDAVECSRIAEVVIDFEENRAATSGNGASGIIQENDRVLNIDLGDVDMKDGMPKTAILMLKPNGCEAEFVQISLYDT